MTLMAAACGVLLVVLGFWSTGRAPTDGQMAVEITCLVGGLLLCFVAVILARLAALGRRLDGFEVHFRAVSALGAAAWGDDDESDAGEEPPRDNAGRLG